MNRVSTTGYAPRVRFAPSPTGPMHMGGARTALFNWFFAKKEKGQFILRIEDSDRERSKREFEADIISGLKWLGLDWDEFYRVSDRIPIYTEHLKKLLAKGYVYYCFCSQEELETERQGMLTQGLPPKYSGKCRSLSEKEIQEKLAKGNSYVLRFKVPEVKVDFKDLLRGKVKFNAALIGDMVIAKSLEEPLYNFAVVVDDGLMKISHVIRGEEHLSNTPKQILIAETLGFPVPQFVHLPLILNPDRSKMSKRFADTALKDYIDNGYLKEALINFLAFLGWHPKEDREVMAVEELVKEFDLKRVQKSPAIFNTEKLNWLNSYYLGKLDTAEFNKLAGNFLPLGWQLNKPIVDAVKNRITNLKELKDLVAFYFELPAYESELLRFKEMSLEKVVENLKEILQLVEPLKEEDFNQKDLEVAFRRILASDNRGEFLWPLRVALSGREASPSPFEIMAALGKGETLRRVKLAIEKATHG